MEINKEYNSSTLMMPERNIVGSICLVISWFFSFATASHILTVMSFLISGAASIAAFRYYNQRTKLDKQAAEEKQQTKDQPKV